jgi:hypothetical protein
MKSIQNQTEQKTCIHMSHIKSTLFNIKHKQKHYGPPTSLSSALFILHSIFCTNHSKRCLGVPSMHFYITLILEVKSIHWCQSANRLLMLCFSNWREQTDIHIQNILPKFWVPWQPIPWDFWVPHRPEIPAVDSNNEFAFIAVVGMVQLRQIMVPAYVEIKCQLDATDEFLLQILLLAQNVSGMSKGAARKPDTQPSAPHYTVNLKTKHQIRQTATTCIILSSSWWWA